ncbi:uncharacterized protein [Miscanthus floridulus]|uniref:uncharacterized protein n=1 Tax=Miscanthus floridulus TaxID=154761 RepID=UPI00345A225E
MPPSRGPPAVDPPPWRSPWPSSPDPMVAVVARTTRRGSVGLELTLALHGGGGRREGTGARRGRRRGRGGRRQIWGGRRRERVRADLGREEERGRGRDGAGDPPGGRRRERVRADLGREEERGRGRDGAGDPPGGRRRERGRADLGREEEREGVGGGRRTEGTGAAAPEIRREEGGERVRADPVSELHVRAAAADLHDRCFSKQARGGAPRGAAALTSLHLSAAAIELAMPASLHSPKHQDDAALEACVVYVAYGEGRGETKRGGGRGVARDRRERDAGDESGRRQVVAG